MGTRSVTRVHEGSKTSPVLVAIYKQMGGYYEDLGEELQEFLNGYTIVNGISVNTPEKAANGMGCLAAQLIKHFKKDIGGIYITSSDDQQEFNYDIFIKNGKLCLEGSDDNTTKKFKLKSTVNDNCLFN